MAEDEELRSELNRRMDALDNSFADLVKELRAGNGKQADNKMRSIQEEFSAEELQTIRDRREYEAWRRNAERFGEELEREADTLIEEQPDEEDDDEDESDEEDDDETLAPTAKTKAKPKAKPRPRGGRHPKAEPAEPEPEAGGILSWLVKD